MSFAAAPSPAIAQRDGKKLYLPRFASLPPNCVKCGQPAEKPFRKKFFWHPSWLYIMILFPGLLIYAIVALIVRKNMELDVPICEQHHGERKRFQIIGALLMIGSIPGGMILNMAVGISEGGSWIVGVISFLAGAIFIGRAGSVMSPKKIDDTHGEFGGVSEEFLKLLPERGPGL
ncbi:MAG TPA: hypothetical protein VM009_00735 [Terriglobales bacterium]|nr:hypothetical protein [Terriglobales bacterium]